MPKSVALRFWTEAETFNLIEYVSHFPCIYDSQNAQYKNVLIKTQAKAKIASNFGNCDPNEAFAKWQLLKTRYQREKKLENEQPPSRSSAYAGKIKAVWMFMKPMSFLEKHIKQRMRTSNINRTEKTPGIAKNAPLSPPVSKISDDGESSSITIDDENYQIDEGSTNNISKKKVEICPDFNNEDLNNDLALIHDSEALENDLLGDEETPSTSFGLPKSQLKKTGFPESVMQPKSDQNNKDSTTKDGQGSTKHVKRNSIDDSRSNSKRRKNNPVLAADEKKIQP